MILTEKELEIMTLIWSTDEPMTAAEIIKASENRTWRAKSIFVIMNSLLRKKVIVLANLKPTSTNTARAYRAALSAEEYAVSLICGAGKLQIPIDVDLFIKHLKQTFEE